MARLVLADNRCREDVSSVTRSDPRVLSWLSSTTSSSFHCVSAGRLERSFKSVNSGNRRHHNRRRRVRHQPPKNTPLESFLDMDMSDDENDGPSIKRVSQVNRAESALLRDVDECREPFRWSRLDLSTQHSDDPSSLFQNRANRNSTDLNQLAYVHPFSVQSTCTCFRDTSYVPPARIDSINSQTVASPSLSHSSNSSQSPQIQEMTSPAFFGFDGMYTEEHSTLVFDASALSSKVISAAGSGAPLRSSMDKRSHYQRINKRSDFRLHVANWTEEENHVSSPPPMYSPQRLVHSRSSSSSSKLSSLDELIASEREWTMEVDQPESNAPFIPLPPSPSPSQTSLPKSRPPTYMSVFSLAPKPFVPEQMEVMIQEVDGVRFELVT